MSRMEQVQGLKFDEIDLDDDALVAGGVLLIKVVEADGTTSVRLRHDGMNWLERLGMLRSALLMEEADIGPPGEC